MRAVDTGTDELRLRIGPVRRGIADEPGAPENLSPGELAVTKKAVYVGTADEVVAPTSRVPPGRSKCSPPTGRARRSPGARAGAPMSGDGPATRSCATSQSIRCAVARDVVRAVRERDAYANLLLPSMLRERGLSGRDAALATELTYGTLRAQGTLDKVIASAAGRPVTEIDAEAARRAAPGALPAAAHPHRIPRCGLDVGRSGPLRGRSGPAGFVNAVLRKISQRDEEMWADQLAPSIAQDPVGHLAFAYAHPRWIAEVFADALGGSIGSLQAALAADDSRPPVHPVAAPVRSATELALIAGGDEAACRPIASTFPAETPALPDVVREGLAGVRDEGSQLVAIALTRATLDGPDGGRWLDLCAGPGGRPHSAPSPSRAAPTSTRWRSPSTAPT